MAKKILYEDHQFNCRLRHETIHWIKQRCLDEKLPLSVLVDRAVTAYRNSLRSDRQPDGAIERQKQAVAAMQAKSQALTVYDDPLKGQTKLERSQKMDSVVKNGQ